MTAIAQEISEMGVSMPFGWNHWILGSTESLIMETSMAALATVGSAIGIIYASLKKHPSKPSQIDWIHGSDKPWPQHAALKRGNLWKQPIARYIMAAYIPEAIGDIFSGLQVWFYVTLFSSQLIALTGVGAGLAFGLGNKDKGPVRRLHRDSSFLRTAEQRRQHYQELVALMAEIGKHGVPQPSSETPKIIEPQDIDPKAVKFTMFKNTEFGPWFGYRPDGENRTRLYHVHPVNSTAEYHQKAVAELEKCYAKGIEYIVAATHGLVTDIGPARFYELLELNAESYVNSANRTTKSLDTPSVEDFAQAIVNSAHRRGYLSPGFKCGGRYTAPCPSAKRFVCGDSAPLIPCPDHPIGGPWIANTTDWANETQSLATYAAALASGEDTTTTTTSLVPYPHVTGHGPVVPNYISYHHFATTSTGLFATAVTGKLGSS